MDPFSLFLGAVSLFGSLAASGHASNVAQSQAEKAQDLGEKQLTFEKDQAERNFGFAKEAYEYQKELNNLQMQREDTAIQRQVADLKAAGLSPLMASGGSSTGQYLAGNTPQFDTSGIASAMSNLAGIYMDKASMRQQAYQFARQQHLQTAQSVANLTSLKLDNDLKREEIKSQKIINDYNLNHGVRDPGVGAAVVDAIMSYLSKRGLNPAEMSQKRIDEVKEGIVDKLDQFEQSVRDVIPDSVSEPVTRYVQTFDETFRDPGQALRNDIQRAKDLGSKVKEGLKKSGSYLKNKGVQIYNWYKKKRGK